MLQRVGWVIVPIVLVGLLGFAVLGSREPAASTAFTLRTGVCFDVPSDAQVGDIPTVDCSAPHDAEALLAVALNADAPSGGDAYPGLPAIAEAAATHCGPTVVNAYAGPTGSSTLAVAYFYPDANAWARGERQLTCYLHPRDGAKLTAPISANWASAPPS